MHMTTIRVRPVVAIVAAVTAVTAAVLLRSANAQDLLNRDWTLDPRVSHVYIQTTKEEKTVERHQFTRVEGGVTRDGNATVKIDLGSIETGLDLRNVRMRFLLFETFKFPRAEITARLDKAQLQGLMTGTPVRYPLVLDVNMHGMTNKLGAHVLITRTSDTTVSVATIEPIVVSSESFGFTGGLAKLSDAAAGISINPSAVITFDLVFGTGSRELDLVQASQEKDRIKQETGAITAEGCETRFIVISESRAIYFKTGSAELDSESEPLLDSGADIASRCPSVRFEIEGHTDSIGGKRFNQRLSERRAQAVVDYLTAKGISKARIRSSGYGDTHPVAPNNTEANRAKNRRIEFKARRE